MSLSVVLSVLLPTLIHSASYKLVEERKGNTFFDGFNFETHGGTFSDFILSESQAKSMGLINTTSNTAYIGTDYWNKVNSSGRPAIQIGSKTNYTQGLLIVDISHMPFGCGVWPALSPQNHTLHIPAPLKHAIHKTQQMVVMRT